MCNNMNNIKDLCTVRYSQEGGGGAGGQIAPGPEALGAPRNLMLGPSHFSGEIFLFSGRNVYVLGAKYRNLVWKIAEKSHESGNFFYLKRNYRPKNFCPGLPPSSRRPWVQLNIKQRSSILWL
jgi:hypothetical protein